MSGIYLCFIRVLCLAFASNAMWSICLVCIRCVYPLSSISGDGLGIRGSIMVVSNEMFLFGNNFVCCVALSECGNVFCKYVKMIKGCMDLELMYYVQLYPSRRFLCTFLDYVLL